MLAGAGEDVAAPTRVTVALVLHELLELGNFLELVGFTFPRHAPELGNLFVDRGILEITEQPHDVGREIRSGNFSLSDGGEQRPGGSGARRQRVEGVLLFRRREGRIHVENGRWSFRVIVRSQSTQRAAAHHRVVEQRLESGGQFGVLGRKQGGEGVAAGLRAGVAVRERGAQRVQGGGAAKRDGEGLRELPHLGVRTAAEFVGQRLPAHRHLGSAPTFQPVAHALEHIELELRVVRRGEQLGQRTEAVIRLVRRVSERRQSDRDREKADSDEFAEIIFAHGERRTGYAAAPQCTSTRWG